MTYSPNNQNEFFAAFAGALTGIGIGSRPITSADPSIYSGPTSAAFAFAVEFDTLWGDGSPDSYQLIAIGLACQCYWQNRGATSTDPTDYEIECAAIIAAIQEGELQLEAENIYVPDTDTWLQNTDIYWDPQAGLDTAAGNTSNTPVQTFAEIIRRYGTDSPILPYGQSLVIHQLSSQSIGTDPVFFAPKLSNGAQAWILGSLQQQGNSFVAGTVTQPVRTGPGSLGTVAGLPAGAAAGMVLYDVTRNSYSSIVSMNGSTATICQVLLGNAAVQSPPAPQSLTDTIATFATGDTMTLNVLPLCNLRQWQPYATDNQTSNNNITGSARIQFLNIADSSGGGISRFVHASRSVDAILCMCKIPGRLVLASEEGGIGSSGSFVGGCYVLGCDIGDSTVITGGNVYLQGGVYRGVVSLIGGNTNFLADPICLTSVVLENASAQLYGLYIASSLILEYGSVFALTNNGISQLWGPGSMIVQTASTCWAPGGLTFAQALLNSGGLFLGAATTGTSYTAGVWTDGITLTPANLDTHGGLQNPRTGARYATN
jgi:hypothetical protein